MTESVGPEYVFRFDVIASDREGYYFDRWDRASRYEVIGRSKQDRLSTSDFVQTRSEGRDDLSTSKRTKGSGGLLARLASTSPNHSVSLTWVARM